MPVVLEAGGALGGGYYLGGGGVGGKLADKSGVFTVRNGGLVGDRASVQEEQRRAVVQNNFTPQVRIVV